MMKHFVLLFALFMTPLFAEEEQEETRQGILVENDGDVLQKLTVEIPEVQAALQTCKDQGKERDDECVWNNLGEAQSRVLEAINEYQQRDGTVAAPEDDENAPKYNYNIDNFKQTKSEPIKKLEDYLKKRFEEALYGKDNTQGVKAVQDHTNFYRLWQSQLGKNLITELSRYCMFSDPDTGRVPYELNTSKKRKAATFNKSLNIANLGQLDGEQSAAFDGFNKCISQITRECTPQLGNAPNQQQQQSNSPTKRYDERPSGSPDVEEYTGRITSPCEINRYMTGVKKSLKAIEGLVEELGNQQPSEAFAVNLRQQEAMDINKITNVSSGEIMDAEEYRNAVADQAAELDECIADANNPNCQKFTNTQEEAKNLQDEMFIRGLALKKKLEQELTGDDVDVETPALKEFFIEKGMSEENFDRMLAQKLREEEAKPADQRRGEIQILKDLISEVYEEEKKALQKSLQARLNDTTSVPEDTSTGTPATTPDFATIKQRVESSPEELAVVYHYANVVSSFITVTGGDEPGRNTAALAAELANPAFSDGGGSSDRGVASDTGISSDLSALDGLSDPSPGSSGNDAQVQLGSGEIDQIQFGLGDEEGSSP